MQVTDKGSKAKGSIPEKLTIWTRKDYKHKFYNESVICSAAMVTDAASKPSQETALRWVKMTGWHYVSDAIKEEGNIVPVTVPNEKIPWLRVVGLDLRCEGGRAWKVLTPENHLVDLRDDVLLEVLFNKGIPKGGKIKGPFQWVKLGSQMRIVLVNSTMYRAIKKSQKERELKKKTPKTKASDLKVGGVYITKTDQLKLYFGRVRYNGKLSFLWFEVPAYYQRGETPLDRLVFQQLTATTHYGVRGDKVLCVTGSVGPLEEVGHIKAIPRLDSIPYLRFSDGYGAPIDHHEFDLLEVK